MKAARSAKELKWSIPLVTVGVTSVLSITAASDWLSGNCPISFLQPVMPDKKKKQHKMPENAILIFALFKAC